MKIDITNAVEGVKYEINGVIPSDNGIFDGRQIKFVTDISVNGFYTIDDKIVTINVKVRADLEGNCERCLDELKWKDDFDMEESFYPVSMPDVYNYSGFVIDIDGAIMEQVIFSIPRLLLCKQDCKGLCHKCGTNLNHGQCDCVQEEPCRNNPFAILKSIAGGAENGITKM